jgi:hypothetical protein
MTAGALKRSLVVQTGILKLIEGGAQQGTIPMIKSLVIAASVSLGLAGYAVAQETTTGAPAGTASVNHEPPGPMVHHHHHHHHVHHHHAAPAPAPAPAQ